MKTSRRKRKYDWRFREGKINSAITSLVLIEGKVKQYTIDVINDINRLKNRLQPKSQNVLNKRNLQ